MRFQNGPLNGHSWHQCGLVCCNLGYFHNFSNQVTINWFKFQPTDPTFPNDLKNVKWQVLAQSPFSWWDGKLKPSLLVVAAFENTHTIPKLPIERSGLASCGIGNKMKYSKKMVSFTWHRAGLPFGGCAPTPSIFDQVVNGCR